MTPDPVTLQSQLDRRLAGAQMLASAVQQRLDAIQKMAAETQKLNIEIEQHRGAHAYNAQLIDELQKELAALAVVAASASTPAVAAPADPAALLDGHAVR